VRGAPAACPMTPGSSTRCSGRPPNRSRRRSGRSGNSCGAR
jgi:hypothetical protein